MITKFTRVQPQIHFLGLILYTWLEKALQLSYMDHVKVLFLSHVIHSGQQELR